MVSNTPIPATVERVARAICRADGCDPDAVGVGCGHTMPAGENYPLWRARVAQAEAALLAMEPDPTLIAGALA